MDSFWDGFTKRAADSTAEHAAEIGGLGMLAYPSVQHFRKVHMPENTKHKLELAGLGVLAAPSVYHLGRRVLGREGN